MKEFRRPLAWILSLSLITGQIPVSHATANTIPGLVMNQETQEESSPDSPEIAMEIPEIEVKVPEVQEKVPEAQVEIPEFYGVAEMSQASDSALSYEDFRSQFFATVENMEKPNATTGLSAIASIASYSAQDSLLEENQVPYTDDSAIPEMEYIPSGNTPTDEVALRGESVISALSISQTGYGFNDGQINSSEFRFDSIGSTEKQGTGYLVAQGEHCNIWVIDPTSTSAKNSGYTENSNYFADITVYESGVVLEKTDDGLIQATSQAMLELAQGTDTIYKKMTQQTPHAGVIVDFNGIYSNILQAGDVDKDGRINMIVYDFSSSFAGYFGASNYYNSGYNGITAPPIDAVHMDITYLDNNFLGTFAHELQHLMYYTYIGAFNGSMADTWINESLSGVPDMYYADSTIAYDPNTANTSAQNLDTWRLTTGTINSYDVGGTYGDFVNFNQSSKNYGIGYTFAAFMTELEPEYYGRIYQQFKNSIDGLSFYQAYTYYSNLSMESVYGAAFQNVLKNRIPEVMDLTPEVAFDYVVHAYMESFISGGGDIVLSNGSKITTSEIMKNPYVTIWSTKNGARILVNSSGSSSASNALHASISSGGTVTLQGYPDSASVEATHEMGYTLDTTGYEEDGKNYLKINIAKPSATSVMAYVALYDTTKSYYTSSSDWSKNTNYDLSEDHADLYPLVLGEDNYIKVESDDILPFLYVVTVFGDVSTTVDYEWVSAPAKSEQEALVLSDAMLYHSLDLAEITSGGSGFGEVAYTLVDTENIAALDSETNIITLNSGVTSGTFTVSATKDGDELYNAISTTVSATITVAVDADAPVVTISESYENGDEILLKLSEVANWNPLTATAYDQVDGYLGQVDVVYTVAGTEKSLAEARSYLAEVADRAVTVSFTVTDLAGNSETASVTLKSMAETAFLITVDANGGEFGEDRNLTAWTNDSGYLTQEGINSLTEPTYHRYTFYAWYAESTCLNEITTSTQFSENTTIYARWTENAPENLYVTKDGVRIDSLELKVGDSYYLDIDAEPYNASDSISWGYTYTSGIKVADYVTVVNNYGLGLNLTGETVTGNSISIQFYGTSTVDTSIISNKVKVNVVNNYAVPNLELELDSETISPSSKDKITVESDEVSTVFDALYEVKKEIASTGYYSDATFHYYKSASSIATRMARSTVWEECTEEEAQTHLETSGNEVKVEYTATVNAVANATVATYYLVGAIVEDPHSDCDCPDHGDIADWVELTADLVDSYVDGILPAGNYFLGKNVQLNEYNICVEGKVSDKANVNLCLNGFTLTARKDPNGDNYNSVIYLKYADFTLYDNISNTGKLTGGTGYITGSVYDYGGGIYANNSSVTLLGGTITGNGKGTRSSEFSGAGVYGESSAIIVGEKATISGNMPATAGGGVYIYSGTLTVYGTITKNESLSGGGICLYMGSIVIDGGTVADNTSSETAPTVGSVPSIPSRGIFIRATNSTDPALTLKGNTKVDAVFTLTNSDMAFIQLDDTFDNDGTISFLSYYDTLFTKNAIDNHIDVFVPFTYEETLINYKIFKESESSNELKSVRVYEITLDYNYPDNTEHTDTLTTGREYTLEDLADAELTGFIFMYWMDKDGNKVTVETEFCEDTTIYAKWDIPEITLKYEDAETSDSTLRLAGENNSALYDGMTLPIPEREGYTFKGWFTDTNGGGIKKTNESTFNKDDILYACWERIYYVVSWQISDEAPDVVQIEYDSEITEVVPIEKEGYTFDGWYENKIFTSEDTKVTFPVKNLKEDKTFYGKWVINEYTVTFKYEDDTTSDYTETVEHGEKIKDMTDSQKNPTRTGYQFDDWYYTLVDNTETEWDFDTPITSDLTIYAKWDIEEYTVIFKQTGDMTSNKEVTVEYDNLIPSSDVPNPTNDDFSFLGWYTEDALTNKFDTATDKVTRDLTLWAKWSEPYTITVKDPEDSDNDSELETGGNGKLGESMPADLDDEDLRLFKGWYTAIADGDAVDKDYVFSGDTDIYPQWYQLYMITLNTENAGGTVTGVTELKTDKDGKIDFSGVTTTADTDYTFKGWFTDKTGGDEVSSETKFSATSTIYAHWSEKSVAVTGVTLSQASLALDLNGTKTDTLTATISPDTATDKTVSWKSSDEAVATVDSDGKVTAVKEGTTTITVTTNDGNFTDECAVTVTDSTSTTTEYTITLVSSDSDKGTLDTGSVTTVDGKITKAMLDDVVKTGVGNYEFDDWYTTTDYDTKIDYDTVYKEDTKIYANWIEKSTTPVTHTVTWYVDGTEESNETVNDGTSLTLKTYTAQTGKTFDGWFKTKDYSDTKLTEDQTITADTDFYGRWVDNATTPSIYTITLISSDNGAIDTKTLTTEDDGTITKAMLDAVEKKPEDGYRFKGWYTSANAVTAVDVDTVYTKNTSIYAVFELIPVATYYTVKFDVNGGSAIASQEVVSGGYITPPSSPVRSNYSFAGWYTTASFAKVWSFTGDTVEDDMTLYAKWTAITSEASSGEVVDSNFNPISDATVALMINGKTYYSAISDDSGDFYFDAVSAGTYNLRVTKGDTIYTTTVEIASSTVSLGTLQIPLNNVSSVVSISSSSPVQLVNNLSSIANSLAISTYSYLKLAVDLQVSNSSSSSNQSLISSKKDSGDSIISYFDMDVVKTVTTTDYYVGSEKLDELPSLLEIVITIPSGYRDEESYSIYRVHDGSVDRITTTRNSSGEKIVVSEDGNSLTLYTKKFSTYALAYCESVPTKVRLETYLNNYYSSSSTIGTVKLSTDSAYSGDTVTVTTTANSGFKVDSVVVTTVAGADITVTEKSTGVYTFTQKNAISVVKVYFATTLYTPSVPEVGSTTNPQVSYFSDVSVGDPFCEAVNEVASLGLMVGTGTGTFSPYSSVTRGMIVTILHMYDGGTQVFGTNQFSDVSTENYYYNAVVWAQANGVISGFPDGTFRPDQSVTKEQLAVILESFTDIPGHSSTSWIYKQTFADQNSVSTWADSAVEYCLNLGILSKNNNYFQPQAEATRAEVAVSLSVLLDLN